MPGVHLRPRRRRRCEQHRVDDQRDGRLQARVQCGSSQQGLGRVHGVSLDEATDAHGQHGSATAARPTFPTNSPYPPIPGRAVPDSEDGPAR